MSNLLNVKLSKPISGNYSMLNGILELKVNKKIKLTLQTRQGEVIIY